MERPRVGTTSTQYNHDAYFSSNNTNCQVIDNVFADAAAYGLQARSGGIVQGNVFINDPFAMSFGVVDGASTTVGGVSGSVTGNVFIGGGSLGGHTQGDDTIILAISGPARAPSSAEIYLRRASADRPPP